MSLQILDDRERAVIEAKRALQGSLVDLDNSRLDLARVDQSLTELTVRDRQRRQDLLVALQEAVKTLSGGLASWDRSYVLRAPITGKVSLSRFWAYSQFVHAGDEVLAIVPTKAGPPLGESLCQSAARVRSTLGSLCFIRLENYPSEQCGFLKGRIAVISPVPLGAHYAVEVALLDGLVTTFGQRLPYQQEMQGQAEIVIEDLRVIDRIVYQFRRLLRDGTVVPPPAGAGERLLLSHGLKPGFPSAPAGTCIGIFGVKLTSSCWPPLTQLEQ